MNTNIGLTDEQRDGVVSILNTLLADVYLMYTKTRNYHWNVVGPQFNDLHKFFEVQYEALNDIVDEVAERARSLGGNATGTLVEFLKQTRLQEAAGEYPEASEMIAHLLADHETTIRNLRMALVTGAFGNSYAACNRSRWRTNTWSKVPLYLAQRRANIWLQFTSYHQAPERLRRV